MAETAGKTLASVKSFLDAIAVFNIAFDFAIDWLSEMVFPVTWVY